MIDKDFTIIAHRGFSSKAPENTLSAIKAALDIGVDMIEIDIHQTFDDYLVVIHDEVLDRTTNGSGSIKSKNLSYIKELDAGSWIGEKFLGECVPLLSEVLALINGKAKLLIEVKGSIELYTNLPKLLKDDINSFKALDWCVVQSFDSNVLKEIYKFLPNITYYQLVESNLREFKMYPAFINAINPDTKIIDRELVNDIHRKGLKVYPYTVNQEEEMLEFIDYGVDGIITDFPDILRKLINDLPNYRV